MPGTTEQLGLGRIEEVFCEVMGLDAADVSDETAYATLGVWDSLKHIEMVARFEAELGLDIDIDDVINMSTVGKIKEILSPIHRMNFGHYLFEHCARSAADCLVGHQVDALSHAELWRLVRELSAALRSRGQGRLYLLLARNGPFFVQSYVATILSGNVAVPLEPRIASTELKRIAARGPFEAAFVEASVVPKLAACAPGVEPLTPDRLPADEEGFTAETATDDLAVILFTSGTTGERKGAMLTHGNLCANTESILAYLRLTAADRMLVTMPFSYCYGASWLHTHLRVGGSLALSNSISLGVVPDEIDRYRCTGLAGVPSTYQILAAKTDFTERRLPTLRYMAQAGGKLPEALILRFADAFPDTAFYVMYGATEATARLSCLPPELLRDKLGSIGKGIPGVSLVVRLDNGLPAAPGEIGEIVAAGPNIMSGYYQDPEGTAQVLRGGELYTGDLATVDEQGFIYVVGRRSQFIKSAGHRISPIPIEELIQAVEGVVDCRVLGVPDDLLGEAVVVALATDGSGRDSIEVILDRCRAELPSFMLPRRVEILDALPRTASQKVDDARLLEMLRLAR